MELFEKLEELNKNSSIDKKNVLEITNIEELFFNIIDQCNNEPNYLTLYPVFEDLRKIGVEKGRVNIFEEHLTLKFNFLREVYGIDFIWLSALMAILGPVLLDYELEERIFKENKFYQYYISRYTEYKNNNELAILAGLNNLDFEGLKLEGEQFQNLVKELSKLNVE